MADKATTYRIELDPTITEGILARLADHEEPLAALEADQTAEDRTELSAAGRRLAQG